VEECGDAKDLSKGLCVPAFLHQRVYHYDRWPKFTPSLFMHETRFPKPLGTVSGVGRVRSGGEDGEALQADVFIFAVWFHIFTALVEECGDAKDLSKGLDVLAHLKLKELEPSSDIFRALTRATEAKGDKAAAARLVDEMCNFSFSLDSSTSNALIRLFTAHGDKVQGYQSLDRLAQAAAKSTIEKQMAPKRGGRGAHERKPSIMVRQPSAGSGRQPRSPLPSPAEMFERQQAMFEICFPGLAFRLDPCENCQEAILDQCIRSQWKLDDPNHFTIICPHCKESVVPRFQVLPLDATPDPINSLMYLSPAVLKKNILELLHQKKASYLTTIHFNEQHAQSYWNLAWYLTNLHLPTDFCVLRVNNKDKEHRPQASIFAVGQHSPRGYALASADSRKPKFQPQKWNGKEEPIAGL